MAWTDSLFRKRDVWIVIAGAVIMQLLAAMLINRFMFHPVKFGYDKALDGYVDIGTNGVPIAARALGPHRGKKAILYCHGNAEDLTAIEVRFDNLLDAGYTVATFDYPGYGLSGGSPSEEGCCRNAHRMFDWLVENRGFAPNEIFVVGYSIGTGVAVELAEKREVGGLWLEASYVSAPRILTRIRLLLIDPFPSSERIGNVRCPIVMLHGTDDRIIPYSQGWKLYQCAKPPKWFIPVKGAGHVDFIDVMGQGRYGDLLLRFVQTGSLDGDSRRCL